MSTARDRPAAALLQDGHVLIAGGDDATTDGQTLTVTQLASAEIYDPRTGTFQATGAMSSKRGTFPGPPTRPMATLLADGRVLIAGGWGDGGGVGRGAYDVFDPATGTFSRTALIQPPAACPNERTITRLLDGRVLITCIAGSVQDQPGSQRAVLYDPTSGAISATGDPTTLNTRAATLLLDGRVLLTGRRDGFTSLMDVYDPATGAFTGLETGLASSDTAVRMTDGRVLFLGETAQIFDPASNTLQVVVWETSSGGPGLDQAGIGTATLLSDGRVLVLGSEPPRIFDPGVLPERTAP